jgi:hypothetical protein
LFSCSCITALLRFNVAAKYNLDIKDEEQKQLLDQILAKLPQDKLWDTSDPTEATYLAAGFVRYHFGKNLGQTEKHAETDIKEGILEKDMTKRVRKEMAQETASSSTDIRVKFEHPLVQECLDEKTNLQDMEKKLGRCIADYKVFRAEALAKLSLALSIHNHK